MIKTKLLAILGGIAGFLLVIIKFLTARNKALKDRVKRVENQLKFNKRQGKLDAEIEQDFSHRAEEAKRDLEEDRIPDHLRNR